MMKKVILHVRPTRIFVYTEELYPEQAFYTKSLMDEFCRKNLTQFEYDTKYKRYCVTAKFFLTKDGHKSYIVPRPFLNYLIQFFKNVNYEVDVQMEHDRAVTPVTIPIKINEKLTDRPGQTEAIDFLIKNKNTRSGLELQTGKGKTRCAIRTIVALEEAALIITDGLTGQWVKDICKHARISKKKVYIIRKFESLDKLFKSKKKYHIFVASLSTLRNLIKHEDNYEDLPTYEEFLHRYGIGIKIVDEAHKCFHANVMFDLLGDVKTNIYLTATFITGNRMLKKIFNTYFPNQMRFDNVYDKYVDIYGYRYMSNMPTKTCFHFGRYMHTKFERFRLRNRYRLLYPYIDIVICPIIEKHYLKHKLPNGKMLIFFALKDSIRIITQILRTKYPDLKINGYISGDPDTNISEADIILSTHKGCGTGTDIKNLQTVFNTVSMRAETTTKQILGRLRKLSEGEMHFVDIYASDIPIQISHWLIRKSLYQRLGKTFTELNI